MGVKGELFPKWLKRKKSFKNESTMICKLCRAKLAQVRSIVMSVVDDGHDNVWCCLVPGYGYLAVIVGPPS